MNAIFEAAIEVERVCRAASFDFCFIGGLAVQRWGQPRMTADVAVTVVTGFGSEEPFVDTLLAQLQQRIPDARQFALEHLTLLVRASNGVDVDIALGAMPFEERAAERATGFDLGGGAVLTTCSAEDLIVHKALRTGRRTGSTSPASSCASAGASTAIRSGPSYPRCSSCATIRPSSRGSGSSCADYPPARMSSRARRACTGSTLRR